MDDYLCHGSGDAHHHSYAEYFIKFINLHQFFFKGIGEQESSLNQKVKTWNQYLATSFNEFNVFRGMYCIISHYKNDMLLIYVLCMTKLVFYFYCCYFMTLKSFYMHL